jgi:hypothetical protein
VGTIHDPSPQGNISRFVASDRPLGFEDMVAAAGVPAVPPPSLPTPIPPPPEVPQPPVLEAPAPTPFQHKTPDVPSHISPSMLERTNAEVELGRQMVERRSSEHQRNRHVAAQNAAKRLVEGAPAQSDDLTYNPPKQG